MVPTCSPSARLTGPTEPVRHHTKGTSDMSETSATEALTELARVAAWGLVKGGDLDSRARDGGDRRRHPIIAVRSPEEQRVHRTLTRQRVVGGYDLARDRAGGAAS
jgi:hypothetical protein